MTILQQTLALLESCSEVYYRYSYYKSLIPELTKEQKEEYKQTIKIYEAKMTVLCDVLRGHEKKKESAQLEGNWQAKKRFYKEYKELTPKYWEMETMLKWEKQHGINY